MGQVRKPIVGRRIRAIEQDREGVVLNCLATQFYCVDDANSTFYVFYTDDWEYIQTQNEQ